MLYLAALVFGLGAFVVQMLSPGDASDAGDGGGHAALEGGHDALVELGEGAGQAHASGGGPASILLSLRFYMFAALGFGIVGAPVTWLGASPPALTFGVAVATGLMLATFASLAFRLLGRHSSSSSAEAPRELLGLVGRVLVACEKERAGKVRLSVRGQLVDYIATTDEGRLELGAAVVVQDVVNGRVHVCAAPAELLPE